MRYFVTYEDDGIKATTIYGYYTNDSSENSANAHVKGTIDDLDTFLTYQNDEIIVNGKEYNVTDSEIMYIIVKK